MKNKFYVSKLENYIDFFYGYSWATGQYAQASSLVGCTQELDIRDFARLKANLNFTEGITKITLYSFDESKNIIGSKALSSLALDIELPVGAIYIAIELNFSSAKSGWTSFEAEWLKEVKPHYTSLEKQYKKETNQVFFREKLNGMITLWGKDYLYMRVVSLEDKLAFYVYRSDKAYSANEFNKTDCVFDHSEGSVRLNIQPKDRYTRVLNSYNKTFDLLKLPVQKTALELTKRSIIQLYIQGENTISNYASGTYWEDEVLEPIDSSEDLLTKYYFAKGPKFAEVSLLGFNYDINTVFRCMPGQTIWNGKDKSGSIVFSKVYSAGTTGVKAFCLSDGTKAAYTEGNYNNESTNDDYDTKLTYDTYRIEIYTGLNGTGTKIYQSEALYGNDSNFILSPGSIYKMTRLSLGSPYLLPEPESFYLGERVIEYQIWGRLLCDVDKGTDGTTLYDLPYDDFATERANFRKCLGLVFSQESHSLVNIVQSQATTTEPTPYGLTEYNEYFKAPQIGGSTGRLYPYPLAKSTWGNTSLWVGFEESNIIPELGLENWVKTYYKKIRQKDNMEIGAVIKALLAEIDPSVTFESTSAYSQFLYGSVPGGYSNSRLYITQKSNILKGEYDQAAQKAEITFEQLMNMLRDCFKCYWFIDSDNRLRLEHIRYFMNGLSYEEPELQFDLTKKFDKFNKKVRVRFQQEITFDKSELSSRYEFAWADDTTDVMGGSFTADITSNYIQQNQVENINIGLFTSDIDFMMFAPSKFSQDGFALIIAQDYKVPIVYAEIYNQQYAAEPQRIYAQNYYASFVSLFNNYMFDMPSWNIHTSIDSPYGASKYSVDDIKKCMLQKIEFQVAEEPNIYKLIKTMIGNGTIQETSINIDTDISKITLAYKPA